MIKKITLLAISVLLTGNLLCQINNKLGYIDSDKLIKSMPDNDTALAKFEKAVKDYQRHLEVMQTEFNRKYQEYVNNRDSYLESIRRMKEDELQDMNIRIQQFQQDAQEHLENKRQEVFKPVIEKANNAIADVAKENNFGYIFDISTGFVVFYDENTTDILPLVKKKLKIY